MKFPMDFSAVNWLGQVMTWQPRRTATRSSLLRCRKLGRRSCKRCVRWNTGGFYVVACNEGWKDEKKPEVQWGWNWLNWFKQMDKSHFKWFNIFWSLDSWVIVKHGCIFNRHFCRVQREKRINAGLVRYMFQTETDNWRPNMTNYEILWCPVLSPNCLDPILKVN